MNLCPVTHNAPASASRGWVASFVGGIALLSLLSGCYQPPSRHPGPTRSGINSMYGGDAMGGRILRSSRATSAAPLPPSSVTYASPGE